jgi:hypothetical protein
VFRDFLSFGSLITVVFSCFELESIELSKYYLFPMVKVAYNTTVPSFYTGFCS